MRLRLIPMKKTNVYPLPNGYFTGDREGAWLAWVNECVLLQKENRKLSRICTRLIQEIKRK